MRGGCSGLGARAMFMVFLSNTKTTIYEFWQFKSCFIFNGCFLLIT